MPPPTPNLLVLRCQDLAASRAFYESLGLTFTRHAHAAGPEHFAQETPTFVLELYPAPSSDYADQTALGLAADDLPTLHAHLTAAGHNPTPIRAQPWGTTFILRDPDRRRVEIAAR